MVAVLAGEQHGVVAVWQLIELGLTRRQIERRVEAGWLHRVFRGVYSVGHPAGTAEAREMAAVLACGDGAVLSHWTAGVRWQLIRPAHGPIHVSAPADRKAQRGVFTHKAQLQPQDRTQRDGIPITSVPRTLLDLAAVANERILRRAVNQAERAGRLNRRAIDQLLERNPRQKGRKRLIAVIAAVNPGTRRTRSDLEVAFLELCIKYDIPKPFENAIVEGIDVDMYWPEARLIVELDSYEYHRTPAEFENDRRRDAYLKTKSYEVLRVPEQWLDDEPLELATTVKTLLSRRR